MDQGTEMTSLPFIGPLKKRDRRILGVLIEKSLTTPEYYPLTMKALVTGCNQKNNRSPLSNYDEYELEESIDKLRERGLLASVQTAGGRTERYRHLLRDKTGWGQKQLAIIGELLLRGRQQLGELRSRAGRMASIESLDELREELERLQAGGYVQSTGELQRRGVEIDHALYLPEENKTLEFQAGLPEEDVVSPATGHVGQAAQNAVVHTARPVQDSSNRAAHDNSALSEALQELREQLTVLSDRVAEIERQLGI